MLLVEHVVELINEVRPTLVDFEIFFCQSHEAVGLMPKHFFQGPIHVRLCYRARFIILKTKAWEYYTNSSSMANVAS